MAEIQTRQCSKWQGENMHQSPLSLWPHHVTTEGVHLQIRLVFSIALKHSIECLILKTAPSSWGINTRACL